MSFRKLFLLIPKISFKTLKQPSKNIHDSKNYVCSVNLIRFYSNGDLDKRVESKNTKQGGDSILGKLFPQSTDDIQKQQQIKLEQEQFEKENKQDNEENEKKWKRMKLGFAVFGISITIAGGLIVYEMGSPRRDDDGDIIRDEFTGKPILVQYLQRTWKELTFYEKMIKEPSREKLLPDVLPPPYQPTYTLVLEFTDVMVHPDWSYQTGWRFKKRPGVDAFLQTIAQSDFEIVIFTTENAFMIWPVIDKLDPENKYISYRLFRDSTHFIDGVHVKNLEGLNRDLSKVIVVDWNKESVKYHPENAIVLKKWKGADDDTSLLDLANLLQAIAISNVSDVREVVRYYSQFDDPIAAFRENQRKLMEQMAEQERDTKNTSSPLTNNWIKTFTRR